MCTKDLSGEGEWTLSPGVKFSLICLFEVSVACKNQVPNLGEWRKSTW